MYMDFDKIKKLIINKEYDLAQKELIPFCNCEDEKTAAKANYLIGYINTQWDYKENNAGKAKRYLRANLNSNFPHPYAYVLYARLEEDKNISENYLKKGIKKFPEEVELYCELLSLSSNKEDVVQLIKDNGFTDVELLSGVISYLILTDQWDKISRFIFRIRNNNALTDLELQYLNLIEAYSLANKKEPDFSKSEELFLKCIDEDTDNYWAYAHYLGLIDIFIRTDNVTKAVEYFDRLPVKNKITDIEGFPYPLGIEINFERKYKQVFDNLVELFARDSKRKNKAKALYALYLYSPSTIWDNYRYSRNDVAAIARYLKSDFNIDAATALFNMRCHYKQFREAYDVIWMFLNEFKPLEQEDICFSELLDISEYSDIIHIAKITVERLQNEGYSTTGFLKYVFPDLIKKLYSIKAYEHIRNISDEFSTDKIFESTCAFECAYAYGKNNHDRAVELYELIIKKEPTNASATNNLGVQYEYRNDLYKSICSCT